MKFSVVYFLTAGW